MDKRQSTEDYLESILMIKNQKGFVRAIDIAQFLAFSRPSVSVALQKLIKAEYVVVDAHTGYISLTTNGEALANNVYQRHRIISDVLISHGVPSKIALEDACRIEHVISEETFAFFQALNKKEKHQ